MATQLAAGDQEDNAARRLHGPGEGGDRRAEAAEATIAGLREQVAAQQRRVGVHTAT